MNENTVLCEARRQVCDERFSRDRGDIDELRSRQGDIERLTIKMGELLSCNDESIRAHEGRLIDLERRPSALWDRLIGSLLGALGAALVSFFIK